MCSRLFPTVCILLCTTLAGMVQGEGLPRNLRGEYEISSADDLHFLSRKIDTPDAPIDGTYVLTCDIDMAGRDFIPIRGFVGRFDGRFHAVRNLTVRQRQKTSVGLFAVIGSPTQSAVVENLALTDIYMSGSSMVGGIAGTSYGTIRHCLVSGEVISVLHCCGGIVGRLQEVDAKRVDKPVVMDCISSASVVSLRDSDSQGGIAGRILARGGTVRNSISTGEVFGRSKTGGLIGWMVAGARLENCVAANRWITPSPQTGALNGVCGQTDEGAVIVHVHVWDRYERDLPAGAKAFPAADLLAPGQNATMGWDSHIWTWKNDGNAIFPMLRGFPSAFYFDFTWQDVSGITPRVSSTLDAVTITLVCGNRCGDLFDIGCAERGLPEMNSWSPEPSRTFTGLQPATAYEFCYRVKRGDVVSRWYRLTVNTSIPVTDDPTPRNISAVVSANPSTSMNFAWTTLDTSLHCPTVTLWPVGQVDKKRSVGGSNRSVPVSRSVDKNLHATYYNFHSVRVTGLKPATRYAYTVGDASGSTVSKERFFTTSTRKSTPFRFVYVTDPQIGIEKARHALKSTFANLAALDPEPAFVYIAGDMAERGYNCAQMDWMHQAADTLLARSFIAAAHGNHDETDIFLSYYPLPETSSLRATYTFDYGDAHFMVLNTELNTRPELELMARWLEEDYARNARRWNLVMLHKAFYAATDHVDDQDIGLLREVLCPVFERLGIDAVLMGHDHCFTRSFVLDGRNAAPTPETSGVLQVYTRPRAPMYIVNGTAGTSKWYKKIPYDASKLIRVAADYAFADKCSSDYEKAIEQQSYSMVTVRRRTFTIDTYFFCAPRDGSPEVKPYLYDSVTIKK